MPPEPVTSVVTIFRNEERFLPEAVDSVLAQTSAAWELLLIDDGSTDGSSNIARRYAERHPQRIRYLTHDAGRNRGKSVSRNLGLREARGDLVAFLDGDDAFLPDRIEQHAEILTRESAAMVYGPTLYWRSWSNGELPDTTGRLGVAPYQSYPPPQLLELFLRDGGTVPCICGLTVRRSVVLETGGFDAQIDDLFEDQVLIAKICARYPVFVDGSARERYRQHAGSTSQRAIEAGTYHPRKPNSAEDDYLSWLEEHLESTGHHSLDLRAALTAARRPYEHPFIWGLYDRGRRLKRRIGRLVSDGAR